MRQSPISSARAALYGTLIGDALGRPYEGIPIPDAARAVSDARARLSRPSYFFHSDDGEMMLALLASLRARRALDVDHFARTLAETHEPARGYGKGARATFRAILAGERWDKAARSFWSEGSRGVGAAVRVAPLLLLPGAIEESSARARASARVTHAHAEAVEGAAFLAALMLGLAKGESRRAAVGAAARCAPAYADPSRRALDLLRRAPHDVAPVLGNGVWAREAVPAALWAFAGAESFPEALLRAISLGGDTDSIGAIAGALAGACFGVEGVPPASIEALEAPARVAVAQALLLY